MFFSVSRFHRTSHRAGAGLKHGTQGSRMNVPIEKPFRNSYCVFHTLTDHLEMLTLMVGQTSPDYLMYLPNVRLRREIP